MRLAQAQAMDDATRAALASGRAEPALGLFVNTLLEMNGISLDGGEAISGAMLERESPAEMSPHALDMVFAAIEKGGQGQKNQKKRELVYPELKDMPAALKTAILETEARRAWTYAGPGIRSLQLAIPGPAKIEVLRINAGTAVPWHTHKGQELTLCLIGEFSDAMGTYGPGDYSLTDTTIRHQPVASKAGTVYALAVTDAGLKFEGLLGALQKLFGQG
jgi:putative transcriptional regulator